MSNYKRTWAILDDKWSSQGVNSMIEDRYQNIRVLDRGHPSPTQAEQYMFGHTYIFFIRRTVKLLDNYNTLVCKVCLKLLNMVNNTEQQNLGWNI